MEIMDGYDRMTQNTKDTESNRIADFERHLVDNLNQYLSQNNISQEGLSIRCKENGYNISQSTISRLCSKQRRITVYYLHAICHTLGIKTDVLMEHTGLGSMRQEFLGVKYAKNWILSDPYIEEQDFEAYIGDYYIYYISTNLYDHKKIIKGRLSIEKRRNPPYCYAGIKINSEAGDGQKEILAKYFQGQLVVVRHKNVAYIVVADENDGEISIIMIRHQIYSVSDAMECRVGAALTVSTGEKAPCVQRILISRKALSEKGLEYLKPVLRLGKDRILILKKDYEEITDILQIPEKEKEKINRYLDEQEYLEISENILNEIHEKVLKEELEDMYYKFQGELYDKDVIGKENDCVNAVQDKKMYMILNFLKQEGEAYEPGK